MNNTNACDLLGCPNRGVLDLIQDINIRGIGAIVPLFTSLIFIGILIFGIFYVIKGSLKIIQSEGNEDKIKEGVNIFKGVFIGILMIFIGILGLILVLGFFQAGEITNVDVNIPIN